jgi:flagellar biogenesis protein FliO
MECYLSPKSIYWSWGLADDSREKGMSFSETTQGYSELHLFFFFFFFFLIIIIIIIIIIVITKLLLSFFQNLNFLN